MKSIRLLLFLIPLLSVAQTKTDFNSQLNNLPFVSVLAEPFRLKGTV